MPRYIKIKLLKTRGKLKNYKAAREKERNLSLHTPWAFTMGLWGAFRFGLVSSSGRPIQGPGGVSKSFEV